MQIAEAPSLDDILTKRQLEERFGICRKTVERWVRAGLPMTAVGRVQFFTKPDIAAWIAQHRTRNVTPAGEAQP